MYNIKYISFYVFYVLHFTFSNLLFFGTISNILTIYSFK